MSLMTSALRFSFGRSDKKRDAGLVIPDDVERRVDVQYGEDEKWNRLDVYRPKGTIGKLPVIVSVHGGGWTYGDKDGYQWYCMNLAERGFAVVNFTYRLAPEFKFPSSMIDTCNVFDWVVKNDDWFELDHVFAVGDSAGAHMLTMYCAACNDPGYAKEIGISPSLCPKAVALNCGIYEIDMKKVSWMTKGLMKALLKDIHDEKELRLVNPLPYVNEQFPRAFVMTANHDGIAGGNRHLCLVNKLKSLGVECIDKMYGSDEEKLDHVFHCDIRSQAAKQCNDDECDFFLRD